jgi:single-stranded DNA-binding protein
MYYSIDGADHRQSRIRLEQFSFISPTFIFWRITMLVSISGYASRDLKTTQVPACDGNGTCTVTEVPVRVKVATDAVDWYLVRFTGDALVGASQRVAKNSLISVVGELTFEDWTDEQHGRRSKPVVNASDLQLPA